jgi:ornithine carbamoyltransferase
MITQEPHPRHLLKDLDTTLDDLNRLLDLAADLKSQRKTGSEQKSLSGKMIAILFEKPSTRTRSAFEVAIYEQGGSSTYIDPSDSHVGVSESIEDTATVLGRFYDGIAFRGYAQASVETLAGNAGVPVWNALTDVWHPTQALADLLTVRENSPKPLNQVSVCFAGDGHDNVANSLLVSGALAGLDIRIACPAQLRPDQNVMAAARERSERSDGRILVTDDIGQAVRGVDFLYTDVWVSMGENRTRWAERIPLLRPYRVDQAMIERTGNADVKFLHCLPSIHDQSSQLGRELHTEYDLDGAEVTDDVFRSARSLVFEQAENRLHTIKAVMLDSFTGAPSAHERSRT